MIPVHRRKLGKKHRPAGAIFPRLGDFQKRDLPLAPDELDLRGEGIPYPLLANDRLGDCVCAGLAHHLTLQAACEGRSLLFAEQDVVDFYYKLGNGQDNGLVILDALNYATVNGFPLVNGVKLAGYAGVNHRDTDEMKRAFALFRGLTVGAALPLSAQHQREWTVNAGQPLVGEWEPGSWGGHDLVIGSYNADGVFFITWGEDDQFATWLWVQQYLDESYPIIDSDRKDTYDTVRFDDLQDFMRGLAA